MRVGHRSLPRCIFPVEVTVLGSIAQCNCVYYKSRFIKWRTSGQVDAVYFFFPPQAIHNPLIFTRPSFILISVLPSRPWGFSNSPIARITYMYTPRYTIIFRVDTNLVEAARVGRSYPTGTSHRRLDGCTGITGFLSMTTFQFDCFIGGSFLLLCFLPKSSYVLLDRKHTDRVSVSPWFALYISLLPAVLSLAQCRALLIDDKDKQTTATEPCRFN